MLLHQCQHDAYILPQLSVSHVRASSCLKLVHSACKECARDIRSAVLHQSTERTAHDHLHVRVAAVRTQRCSYNLDSASRGSALGALRRSHGQRRNGIARRDRSVGRCG
jgi:hypothetical protein